MRKRRISHIAAVCIVYREANPEEIFTPVKDATYPLKVWRGHYCFIGGNWTGQAGTDPDPRKTVVREIGEELRLFRPEQSTAELGETAVHRVPITYRVPGLERPATAEEERALEEVKAAIFEAMEPFGDYVLTIPAEVFLAADPASQQTTQVALCSVFEAGLDETAWPKLAELQETFGNISCESETAILTLDKIVREGITGTSGLDRVLRDFFYEAEDDRSGEFPLHPGPTVEWVGSPKESYRDYFGRYEIERIPANFVL